MNLWKQHDKGKAGRYVIVGDEGAWASLTPADGKNLWRLMIHGEPETDPNSVDPAAELRRAIGDDIPFEIVKFGHWIRRRVVADQYGRGRVLLAGDAVHVTPPNGGLGMNTGVGDAVDLGWKLAAVHDGWGGSHLIESYEPERRPVGIRQCDEAMLNFQRYGSRKPVPHVTDETAEGASVRAELGRRLSTANSQAWENPLNTHLGYRYENSPIVVPDGAAAGGAGGFSPLYPNQSSGLPCAARMAVGRALDARSVWTWIHVTAVSRRARERRAVGGVSRPWRSA